MEINQEQIEDIKAVLADISESLRAISKRNDTFYYPSEEKKEREEAKKRIEEQEKEDKKKVLRRF